jgi:hypothetical protein
MILSFPELAYMFTINFDIAFHISLTNKLLFVSGERKVEYRHRAAILLQFVHIKEHKLVTSEI